MKRMLMAMCIAAFAGATATAQQNEIAKYDPAMAVKNAVTTKGVKWIEGQYLPMEGRMFSNVDHFYDRLPANVTTNVNGGVRSMKHHTSGLQFRFKTDSKFLHFKWVPYSGSLDMHHMPSTGVSGIDVYRQLPDGSWRYVKTGCITQPSGGSLRINWTPGEACLVNLPLYNGVKSFKLGIAEQAKIEALEPRKSGVTKPVVFYGTSITHGGCCSRPGLSFVNIIGRRLDVPVVNLGFSGSGRMEMEMSQHLAAIDASCYVLDCLWNMKDPKLKNYEPFIRNLRALKPSVPIVMAEDCNVFHRNRTEKGKVVRALFEKLKSEGWKNIYWLGNEEMYKDDGEGTVDGCHPNDWGMMALADAFGGAVKTALGLK